MKTYRTFCAYFIALAFTRLALGIMVSLAAASSARAVTTDWNTNSSGNFNDASNWDNGAPGSADTAVFGRGSGITYSVKFPGGSVFNPINYATDQLLVDSNSVSFFDSVSIIHPQQASYTLNNATTAQAGRGIIVGVTGSDTAAVLNTSVVNLNCLAATIGDAYLSNGMMNVNGGTFNVTGSSQADYELIVGNHGHGTLNINNGTAVNVSGANGDCVLGNDNNAGGMVAVNSTGSTLAVGNTLWVGYHGSGNALTVTGGGQVTSGTGYVGVFTNATATVDGASSKWTNSANLYIGHDSFSGIVALGTLYITGGGQVFDAAGYLGTNFGGNGTTTVNGAGSTWTSSANLYVGNSGSGTLNITGGGQVNSANGYLGYNAGSGGATTVDGAGSTWTNSGDLFVGSTGAGSLQITAGGQVTSINGTIGDSGGGTVTVDGAGSKWTNTGNLDVGFHGLGTLYIARGGQVSNSMEADIGGQQNSIGLVSVDGAGSTWTIGGILVVGTYGKGTLKVFDGGQVSNSGVAYVGYVAGSSGSATVDGSGSTWTTSFEGLYLGFNSGVAGTLTVRNGGLISGGPLSIGQLGILRGNGTINSYVSNGGTVAPGSAPGALHFNGNYAQTAAGKLQIELGGTTPGTQYDPLVVSGAVTLDGTLEVTLSGDFSPTIGNTFDILDWGSVSGTFATLQLPTLTGALQWNTSQLYATGVLSVIGHGLPGDYNDNGIVDAADYTVWRDTLGQTGTDLAADGNGNGVIDAGDYDVWKTNFGNHSGSGSGATANSSVPEPANLWLLVAGILTLCSRRLAVVS